MSASSSSTSYQTTPRVIDYVGTEDIDSCGNTMETWMETNKLNIKRWRARVWEKNISVGRKEEIEEIELDDEYDAWHAHCSLQHEYSEFKHKFFDTVDFDFDPDMSGTFTLYTFASTGQGCRCGVCANSLETLKNRGLFITEWDDEGELIVDEMWENILSEKAFYNSS
mgnify:CR=1 FL=1